MTTATFVCPDCHECFTAQRYLTNHRRHGVCARNVAVQVQRAAEVPMDGALTLEAGRIRKMKVLALGRWRYIQKLPHSAVSAINRDCQHHTQQVLAAYTTHLHRIFAQNNLRMDSAVEAQLLAASSTLLQATAS